MRGAEQRLQALEAAAAAAPPPPAAAALDALWEQGQGFEQGLAALAARLDAAEARAGAGAELGALREALAAQAAAHAAEQGRLAAAVGRLHGLWGALARAVSEPAAGLAAGTAPAPPSALGPARGDGSWHEAATARALPAPAASASGSLGDAGAARRAGDAAEARPSGGSARAPGAPAGAPPSGATAGGPDPGPAWGPARKRPRLGSGPSAGAEGSNVLPASPPAAPPPPCPAASSELCAERTGCSGASAAAAPAPAELTAAELAEGWLAGLARGPGPPGPAAAAAAAAGLAAALAAGEVPLPCLAAGFETAFLECAAAAGAGAEPGPEAASAGGAAAAGGAAEPEPAGWLSEEAGRRRTFEWLLACAARLDARARGAGARRGVLGALRAHLAARALARAAAPLGAFSNEACALCAAAAGLCRLQGAVQARASRDLLD